MICEKAGCKKKATQHLILIKKETKKRHNYSLCYEHYMNIRLKRLEQALVALWVDDRGEGGSLHKELLNNIDYYAKKKELIELWDKIYLEES